jgi:hypothetical protein
MRDMNTLTNPAHHTATIFLNGAPLLSYRGDTGRILTPSTMPWQVAAQLAGALGLVGENAAIGSGATETRIVGEHAFEVTGDVSVSTARKVEPHEPGYAGPNHWTYVDVPRVTVRWVGTSDYST